ncbi:trans-sulfuration enzyme family protein [Acetobacterium wieringae]|uniref:trans-sulfuration enzyme family protein n=1 Tax=Acetobacterium wieringae TaxID=52694 RepID=UPI0020333332|nr:PLP-dependent aspartate aminotransferase family protein [Acetobacterium wieringae]URN83175.1 PLP-dependent aspartate aminotransferase family protein [Acetobacterium wieringae]
MDFETLCIHGNNNKFDNTGAISVPIFQTAIFAHPGVGESTGYDYTRQQNPTREHLENILTRMEEGVDAMAFSSGMAAISAVMEIFSPGDHIIASDDLYGGSHRLFHHISIKNGISFDLVDTTDLSLIEPLIRPNTRALFIETPTNPMMQVTDLAGVAEIARKHQLLLMVDNTFLTPYFQKPLKLGADIVIHSGTKYLGGHNDTIAGFVVTRDKTLADKLRFIFKTTGAGLAPFDSWLLIRGIKTLPIRMDRQQQNAGVIARWLCQQERIKAVHYVGLESHPSYEISKRQATGFGGMISFEVDSEKTAHHILEGVKLIQYAESLGGVESLITYPMLQTHGDIPEEQREAKGINNRLLRLSVGIESVNDLIDELDRVLKEAVH